MKKIKTYSVLAEMSTCFVLTLNAESYDDAWDKAKEAAEDGKFKEVPDSGDFNIYLVNELSDEDLLHGI